MIKSVKIIIKILLEMIFKINLLKFVFISFFVFINKFKEKLSDFFLKFKIDFMNDESVICKMEILMDSLKECLVVSMIGIMINFLLMLKIFDRMLVKSFIVMYNV